MSARGVLVLVVGLLWCGQAQAGPVPLESFRVVASGGFTVATPGGPPGPVGDALSFGWVSTGTTLGQVPQAYSGPPGFLTVTAVEASPGSTAYSFAGAALVRVPSILGGPNFDVLSLTFQGLTGTVLDASPGVMTFAGEVLPNVTETSLYDLSHWEGRAEFTGTAALGAGPGPQDWNVRIAQASSAPLSFGAFQVTTPAALPEPGALALLCTALPAAWALRRARRARTTRPGSP
jgi:hypothetical protein